MVVFIEIFFRNDHIIGLAVGIGINLSKIHILIHIATASFFSKNYGNLKKHGSNAGNANARSLDGEDFVDGTVGELALKLLTQLCNKGHINLVIQKAIHL